jgi:pimeloyl-ACP methyl ester carboxylesterase
MAVDEKLVQAHRSFRDERLGIEEQFVRLDLATGGTIGVVARPLESRRPEGWVVCHSFGNEQVDLSTTETGIARRLTAAGFPTLRFHCRGYGDADDLELSPGPGTHLDDALRAVAQFRERHGVESVGTVGIRFGGTVAALAADQADLGRLAMISPITSGPRYLSELLRFQAFGTVGGGERATGADLRGELDERGEINIQGWRLTRPVWDELQRLDLGAALGRFRGTALVLQASSRHRVDPLLRSLVERLEELGARPEFRSVVDRAAVHLGYEHYQALGPDVIADTLGELNEALAATIVEWAFRMGGSV